MSRTIAIDPESGELVVAFRFDRAVKDRVKALRGARFHWGTKTWRFAPEHAAAVVAELVPAGFTVLDASLVDPRVAASVTSGETREPTERAPGGSADAGSTDVAPDPVRSPAPSPDPDTFTVSRLLATVGAAVARAFPASVWVTGTLAEFDRGAHRAHVWCKLVEEDADARPLAVFQAVLFAQARERIQRRLARSGLELTDGLAVRVLARVELYAPKGALQLVIEDVDTAWSAGELAVRREEILRELRAAGLDRRQLELPMPALPKRIALVTSAGSDAFHDVLSSLRAGGFGLEVVPFDVRVQGPELGTTVCAALDAIGAAGGYDLVVITRGGGSRVELAGWDDVRVARAVATLPTKVLVAIGHHQDRSVLDEIALSAKTPTEAGEWIVGLWVAAEDALRDLGVELERRVLRRLVHERRHIDTHARSVEVAVRQSVIRHRERVSRAGPRLEAAVRARMRLETARAERLEPRLSGAVVRRSLARRRERAEQLERRLGRVGPAATARRARSLAEMATRLRLVHPDNVLARGFAIVRDASGHPVTTVAGIRPDDDLRVQMRDGLVAAVVSAVEPKKVNDDD